MGDERTSAWEAAKLGRDRATRREGVAAADEGGNRRREGVAAMDWGMGLCLLRP